MRALLRDSFIVRHTRRAMMDFGFGRFLEMFEERFGRVTTTVLLGAIGLAILCVCGDLIISNIILPMYTFLLKMALKKDIWVTFRNGYIPSVLAEGVTIILMSFIAGISIRVYFARRRNSFLNRISLVLDGAEEDRRRMAPLIEDAKRLAIESEARTREARDLISHIYHMTPNKNEEET